MRIGIGIVLVLAALALGQDAREETQRRRIDAARGRVRNMERAVADAEKALAAKAKEAAKCRAKLAGVQARIKRVDDQEAIARNIATATVRHVDALIADYEKRFEAAGSDKERAEMARYVAAYNNMRAARLARIGHEERLKRYAAQRAKLTESADEIEAACVVADADARSAREILSATREGLANARNGAADAVANAAKELEDVAPPILLRVEAAGGKYSASWKPRSAELDRRIAICKECIEAAQTEVAAEKPRIDELIDLLDAQNRLCQKLMDEYVNAVWWQAFKAIFTELVDSAITIAMDFKTWGPYAFVIEAANRMTEVASGTMARDYSVPPGAMARGPNYAGIAHAANLNLVKHYVKTGINAIAGGKETIHTYAFKGLRLQPGNLLAVVRKEVLFEGVEAAVVKQAFSGTFSAAKFVRSLKARLNADFLKDAGLGLLQGAAKEALQQHFESERMQAWFRYQREDTLRSMLLTTLKMKGAARDFAEAYIRELQNHRDELIAQRDRERHMRDFEKKNDEVVEGDGELELKLTFSRNIAVQGVTLGGNKLEGATDGITWTGTFTTEKMPEIAALVVEAQDPVTSKLLDDPSTIATWSGTDKKWLHFEAGPDEHHRIRLRPTRPGTSTVLLFDCSGSMKENNRMAEARRAAADLLDSGRFGPDDEIAVWAFYDRHDIRLLVPFTRDHARVRTALGGLKPTSWTPLARSILMAGEYLASAAHTRHRTLIVLTDGGESCGGNPVRAVAAVRGLGQNVEMR